jgi:hypothetical protein
MALRRIETEIDIEAPAERVWAILTDFDHMPSWNPFIRSVSGEATTGARLSILVSPPGKRAMRFAPTVLSARPNRELRWLGSLFVKGLFDGEHYFLLEPRNERATRFVQGENFSGLLVGPLSGALPATRMGFEAMNAALKQLAEAQDRLQ